MNSSSKSFSYYDNIRAKGNACYEMSPKSVKAKHSKNLFFGHLNQNSIRKKFVSIEELIKRTFDVILISETKIDDSFLNAQFKIEVYINVLRKIEAPLEEDFSFALMKS